MLSKIFKFLKCLFLRKHDYKYCYGNYQTNKDVFVCVNCGKKIEE